MQASIDFDGTLSGSIAGGGGGGGSDVSITPTYNQGTKIADYSIDGNEGTIYTPEIEITKYVSSGVKICEIEGVEIFAPSYGYIDTLGDSNVEQIGGFSQGANVTPVNVKRVSYTNDVSNGEKIGSLTVGDTSYNVYQKQSSNIIVDNNEKVIGTWFGETCYEKTINITVVPPYSSINLSNLNIKDVVNFGGIAKASNGNTIPLGYSIGEGSQYLQTSFEKNTSTLYINMGSGLSAYSNVYTTIQYTKEV